MLRGAVCHRKGGVLLQGCAKVRVGAEGRELSEDVCEAVSVQGEGVRWGK